MVVQGDLRRRGCSRAGLATVSSRFAAQVEAGRNRRVRVTGPPRGAADTGAVPLVVLILPASDRSWGGELTVCNSRDVRGVLDLSGIFTDSVQCT